VDSENNSFSKTNDITPASYEVELKAVVDGEVVPIESVHDPVFSQKMIGDGYGIKPASSTILSPIRGKITEVADSKHAYGIKVNDYITVFIHIGKDTLMLKGEGFTSKVEKDEHVECGQELCSFNLALLDEEDYKSTISVIVLFNEVSSLDVTVHEGKGAEAGRTNACDVSCNIRK